MPKPGLGIIYPAEIKQSLRPLVRLEVSMNHSHDPTGYISDHTHFWYGTIAGAA